MSHNSSQRIRVADLLARPDLVETTVSLSAWVRTFRNNQFIALNDGSSIVNIQAVVPLTGLADDLLKRIHTGAAISVTGKLISSPAAGQAVEIAVEDLSIIGDCDPTTYPLQAKKHGLEFLREKAHLRPRTTTFLAIFRIRAALTFSVHRFFNEKGFLNLHTPIITASDAEGAGELFQVTTLNLQNPPKNDAGKTDFTQDFFARPTNLTVSGQLEGELGAMAMGNVYTFGPTFRAENSNTSRHLAEFWMIEPEMAFYDLFDDMNLAEELLKNLISEVMRVCPDELAFLNARGLEEDKTKPQRERAEMSLLSRLRFCLENAFERLTYTEAFEILKQSSHNRNRKFTYPVTEWGVDLQSEHERYLVERHFKKPIIVYDYPKNIKAFYMRSNEDGTTVRAMDVLFPGIGEIIGGSQREERLERIETRMEEMGLSREELYWYLDTRRFGTAPHSGFGLGFERLVLFITGMSNIRDVIPFPRTPKNASF